jgi:HK97 gp10 family phage protein
MAWAAKFEVGVEGLADLEYSLNLVTEEVSKRSLVKALRAGGQLFIDAMKRRVRRTYGQAVHVWNLKPRPHLVDDIKVRMRREKGTIVAHCGPGKQTAYIANFQEFGTKAHEILPRLKKALYIPGRGFVSGLVNPPHPGERQNRFIKPAFDSTWAAAVLEFKAVLAEAIDKAFRGRNWQSRMR